MHIRLALLISLLLAAPAAAHDPGRWESKPAAALPRQEAALAELNGKLHFLGGLEQGGADSLRHDVYDIAAGTWSAALPLPEPAHHPSAAALGGKVYFLGGCRTVMFVPTGNTWAYDPAAGTWAQRASLPAGRDRCAGAVAVHDGKLIYAGGQRILEGGTPRRVAVALVDAYDPVTNTWTALPDMPTPRDHFGVGVVGDTLYAVGGRTLRFELPVRATEALDLETLTWRGGLAEIPTARGGFAAAVVDGRLITIGGESPHPAPPTLLDAHINDEVEAYSPADDAWRSLAAMPTPRYGIQGAVFGGGIWVAGGGVGKSVLTTGALDVFYP